MGPSNTHSELTRHSAQQQNLVVIHTHLLQFISQFTSILVCSKSLGLLAPLPKQLCENMRPLGIRNLYLKPFCVLNGV